jgi:predicted choloylglycine hydrolase
MRPVACALIVNDFGVKYVGEEQAKHLQSILQQKYTITTNWEGRLCLGMKLNWDYEARTVDISMPGY